MSTWRSINNSSVGIDGDDVEILVSSDHNGNNYIIVSLKHILSEVNKRQANIERLHKPVDNSPN